MEHEQANSLMMLALDDELPEEHRFDLNDHLLACRACRREWQALQAIDLLFKQTPMLSPAAGFTQRTIARLPNRRVRIWAMSGVYLLLLISGIIPAALAIWAISRLSPVIGQPELVSSLVQSLATAMTTAGTVLAALLNSLGEGILQRPMIIGWLLVMAGLVSVWGGVYRQLVGPIQLPISRQR